MEPLQRLEHLLLESHALEGDIAEIFGYRVACRLDGWSVLSRRDVWLEAREHKAEVVRWSELRTPSQPGVVLVHHQKGREATWQGLVRAWELMEDGGRLILAGANDLGIKSAVARLAEELGRPPQLVIRGGKGRAAVFERTSGDGPAVPDHGEIEYQRLRLRTAPGVFSAGELDPGSRLLLDHLDRIPDVRRVFDPGCGCGVLGLAAMSKRPGSRGILADVDDRAVLAASDNAAALGLIDRVECVWWDARREPVPGPGTCDLAVVNPPFHAGGTEVALEPARAIFRAVDRALVPGGLALVVANRTLPWERELERIGTLEQWAQTGRYKLLAVRK